MCLKENSIQQIKKSEIQQFILDMIEDDNTYESSYKENIKSEVDFLLNGISKKFIIPDFLTCKISFVKKYINKTENLWLN